MRSQMIVIGWSRYMLCCILFLSALPQTFAAEPLETTVNYLIDYIGKSDAVFIRNGDTHTPAEAMEHVKAKYAHFKSDIKTPEDFIRLSASKSLLTGKPYLVRPAGGGKETTLQEWLTEALNKHRSAPGK